MSCFSRSRRYASCGMVFLGKSKVEAGLAMGSGAGLMSAYFGVRYCI